MGQTERDFSQTLERRHQAQGLVESCGSYRESLQSNIREKTPGTGVDGELWVIQRESLQSNIREKTPGTGVGGELWVIQRESSVKY